MRHDDPKVAFHLERYRHDRGLRCQEDVRDLLEEYGARLASVS